MTQFLPDGEVVTHEEVGLSVLRAIRLPCGTIGDRVNVWLLSKDLLLQADSSWLRGSWGRLRFLKMVELVVVSFHLLTSLKLHTSFHISRFTSPRVQDDVLKGGVLSGLRGSQDC